MCSYLLWKARGRTVALTDITGSNESFDLRTSDGRMKAMAALTQLAEREHYAGADKQRMVECLAETLRIDFGRLMARQSFKSCAPHPYSSSPLRVSTFSSIRTGIAHRSTMTVHERINENRTRIQQLTGKRPSHFATQRKLSGRVPHVVGGGPGRQRRHVRSRTRERQVTSSSAASLHGRRRRVAARVRGVAHRCCRLAAPASTYAYR